MMGAPKRRRISNQKRRGLAAAELAVCLPVVVLVVFASIEACSLIFLQQGLQTSAYETARFAVAPKSDSSIALARGAQVLQDREIRSASITLDPADVATATRGTIVVATVAAPLGSNRLFPAFFYGDQSLTAQVTMMRE